MSTVRQRIGRCYELSGREVAFSDDPDARLVHGTIQGFGYPPNPHAWVVRGNGIVYDPVLGQEFTGETHRALFRSEVDREYSKVEVAIACVRSRHWGPWETEKEIQETT